MITEIQSLMEKRMEKLGVNRKKIERLPNTLEEGITEIAYLRALEDMARRRMNILFRLWRATSDHAIALERERLKLEKLYIPITHCKISHKVQDQHISSRSREEILETWKGLSQEEIDKMIAQIEKMQSR